MKKCIIQVPQEIYIYILSIYIYIVIYLKYVHIYLDLYIRAFLIEK